MADGPELAWLGRRPRGDAGGGLGRIRQGLGRQDWRDLTIERAPVDDEQAGLDRGPVFGVGAGWEGQAQHDAAAGRERPHRRRIVEQPDRHDRGETAAVRQAVQGGLQVRLEPLERRIGQGDVERAGRRQDVARGARRRAAIARRGPGTGLPADRSDQPSPRSG